MVFDPTEFEEPKFDCTFLLMVLHDFLQHEMYILLHLLLWKNKNKYISTNGQLWLPTAYNVPSTMPTPVKNTFKHFYEWSITWLAIKYNLPVQNQVLYFSN
jgi:hypothetical protein